MSYPLIFGEILYDQFSDGNHTLGGAPFNVAWHLKGLGLEPRILSCIGRDRLGDEIMAQVASWQLDSSFIQRHEDYPTGSVKISLDAGQPTFDIVEDVAYDHINAKQVMPSILMDPPDLLYHGTLAIRQAAARETLLTLRNKIDAPVFVDINLRPPWWDATTLDQILSGTTWLKLNQDELHAISHTSHSRGDELASQARALLVRFDLSAVIVTLGDKGAFIVDNSNYYHSDPVQVSDMVDAVGAGDGFSAVVIAGLLNKWGYPLILERAVEFAAEVCRRRGAINMDNEFYSRFAPEGINAKR